jgi:hypothetical protein
MQPGTTNAQDVFATIRHQKQSLTLPALLQTLESHGFLLPRLMQTSSLKPAIL